MSNSLLINSNNINDENINMIELNVNCSNEIEKIIELNKITKMLFGVELHKITFKNGDMTDLRSNNLIFID